MVLLLVSVFIIFGFIVNHLESKLMKARRDIAIARGMVHHFVNNVLDSNGDTHIHKKAHAVDLYMEDILNRNK